MLNRRRPAPLLWIVSGPSGSGKTSLCRALLEDPGLRRLLLRSVSCTTRPRRPGEKNGEDYRHISREEFRRLDGRGAFLETQRVFDFHYGTPKASLEAAARAGKDLLLSIDVKGARRIRRMFGKKRVVSIFILPPHVEALGERLRRRSTENKKDIAKRLRRVEEEILHAPCYDYVIVNDNFGEALAKIKAIMIAKDCEAEYLDFANTVVPDEKMKTRGKQSRLFNA